MVTSPLQKAFIHGRLKMVKIQVFILFFNQKGIINKLSNKRKGEMLPIKAKLS